MSQTITKICDKIILISFYLLFIIVPLILTPWNYELFEYNKMMVVYGLTIIIMASWMTKAVILKEFKIRRTPFDLPLILFLFSQILSTIFSMDVHTSIWGYYSRFHGGLLSTISYIILFYAFVSNLSDLSYLGDLKRLIKIILATGLVVSLYGILEHFGIDKNLWVQDVQNRVFSTLGQPNWLGAYLAILIPMSLGIMISTKIQAQNSKKIPSSKYQSLNKFGNLKFDNWNLFGNLNLVFGIFSMVFYLTLLFTKSRSGIYAFWLADIIFWGIIFLKRTPGRWILTLFLITNLSFLIITFIVGGSGLGPLGKFSFPQVYQRLTQTSQTAPSSPKPSGLSALESGITESGDIRKIVWRGAGDIFKNNPILGTGVETFAFAYYKYRPVAHNLTSEWDFLYNKAHNEFLNFLATTGILGFGTWMFFIISYIGWSVKKILFCHSERLRAKRGEVEESSETHRQNDFQSRSLHSSAFCGLGRDDKNNSFLLIGLFTGWLSILVTDFFGFSVVIVALLFFLIPGISFVLAEKKSQEIQFNFPLARNFQIGLIGLICLIGLVVEFSLFQMWRADTFFAIGYKLNRSGQVTQAYQNLAEAIKINPAEPYYHDEFSYTLATLTQAAFSQKEATLAGILLQQAIAESNSALQKEPNNVNYFKTRTRVFYSLSQIDPKYNQDALDAIIMASKLAPTDPKIHYNLAILYGRSGQTELALKTLEETIKLKPDYRDPYYALALLEKDSGRAEAAKKNLEFILKNLDPNDAQAKGKLQEWNK